MTRANEQPQKRVLVVDDSKFVRTTFASILQRAFDVRQEVDGEAAWAAIQSDPSIVMLFTDLDMPKLNGFGLLARMRASGEARIRELPAVVISGNEEAGTMQRAREAGANDFISKSAEATEVLARLENVLRLVGARRELEASKQAVEQTATHDPLTGAFTPHYLLIEGRKQFAHARRHDTELSVMALRIETYVEITRTVGKEVADIVLKRIGKLLIDKVRAEDSVARTAEASFVVLAAGTAASQMLVLAQRIQHELHAAKISYRNQPITIGSRFGVASLSLDSVDSIEELLKVAALRLQSGAQNVAPAPAPSAAPVAKPPALPSEIERALRRLEKADWPQLGDAGKEVLRRLGRIAKMIQVKGR